jgi:hypothetical protein
MNETVQIEIRVLIQRLLGMPEFSVRPADDNQPIEGSDIAIVQLTDTESQGWAGNSSNAYQTSIATLTIDFMGDSSSDRSNALPLAMQTNYANDTLLNLDIGYLDCSSARDLTALEIERVKRYQVKMRLSYATTYSMPATVPTEYQVEHEFIEIPIGLVGEP